MKHEALIAWCPKFHCELNPIEDFWCFLKNFVRRNNDKKFENLFPLIDISIQKYIYSGINTKQSLFGAKSQSNIKNHKNIKNFNTNLK